MGSGPPGGEVSLPEIFALACMFGLVSPPPPGTMHNTVGGKMFDESGATANVRERGGGRFTQGTDGREAAGARPCRGTGASWAGVVSWAAAL